MYAIVNISGKQFRAEKGKSLKVPSQSTKVGKKLSYDQVLLTNDNGKVQIGNPFIKNFKVSATVLENGRDKKIIVFKKKRRKGYKRKNGHRQGFSLIQIDSISKTSTAKKTSTKTTKTSATSSKKEEKK
ncbi:MAG: 50S ribosomal protein L21 [bacterium TMED144]|nr:MAG: 50S ribosomal protein L21 [bacterium TMED144]|tara:strand:+ start:3735 stop:4121 length:387 start_codon:yes stop_codon:yes gene_type:complete